MKVDMRRFSNDFENLCKNNAEEVCVIQETGFKTKTFLYKDVWLYVERYIELFKQNALRKGDVILSILPNSVENIFCFLAALKGGYGFAPLSCKSTQREINEWAKIIDPRIILKSDEIQLQTHVSNRNHIIDIKCDGELEWLPSAEKSYEVSESGTLYLYTSGTTGEPKTMVIDGDKLWSSSYYFSKNYDLLESKCRFWNYLPMSYLGGLFNLALIPLSCKGSFLVTEPFSGNTLLNFWENVKKYEITALWFVPTIVNGLLKICNMFGNNFQNYTQNNLKIVFLGTAPIEMEKKITFENELGVSIFENYGLSETTFISCEDIKSTKNRSQSSVGTILPYVEYKLVKYEESNDIFELLIKSPFNFCGYLSKQGKLLKIDFDVDGFFNTKDLVKIDHNGQLVLLGRTRQIIKKGGLFIALKEIENAILGSKYVKEAVAIPIKHDFYGESYDLLLTLKTHEPDDLVMKSKIKLWLVDNLVSYKHPENIIIVDEFPYTPSGKIKIEELKEKYEKS